MHILFVAFIFTLVVFVQASDHFPHPCHETHLVTAKETCKSISSKFKTTEANIDEWNRKFNSQFHCNKVKKGDIVCVKYSSSSSIVKRSDDNLKKDKKKNEEKTKSTKSKMSTHYINRKSAPKKKSHC